MNILRALTLGAATLLIVAAAAFAQVPKAPDGHSDLTGIWQAMGTANWDLEDHASEPGPFYQLGALGAIPPGRGVVEGGEIPYKPEALQKRKENRASRWKSDPELKCYMPGIPRAAPPATVPDCAECECRSDGVSVCQHESRDQHG